jgi:hypothetical protein
MRDCRRVPHAVRPPQAAPDRPAAVRLRRSTATPPRQSCAAGASPSACARWAACTARSRGSSGSSCGLTYASATSLPATCAATCTSCSRQACLASCRRCAQTRRRTLATTAAAQRKTPRCSCDRRRCRATQHRRRSCCAEKKKKRHVSAGTSAVSTAESRPFYTWREAKAAQAGRVGVCAQDAGAAVLRGRRALPAASGVPPRRRGQRRARGRARLQFACERWPGGDAGAARCRRALRGGGACARGAPAGGRIRGAPGALARTGGGNAVWALTLHVAPPPQ